MTQGEDDQLSAAPTALGSSSGSVSQPFRAGLTFGGRPSGPYIYGDLWFHKEWLLTEALLEFNLDRSARSFARSAKLRLDGSMSTPLAPREIPEHSFLAT
jgi:hypothetical protein